MKKRFFLILICALFYSYQSQAQSNQSFDIENDGKKDENVRQFYAKFNAYIDGLRDTTHKATPSDPKKMIQNFVIFSEDGLIMKDLKFHSQESCKENILLGWKALGKRKTKAWMYVDLESHVNLDDLKSILAFLKKHKIDYQFGPDGAYDFLIKEH